MVTASVPVLSSRWPAVVDGGDERGTGGAGLGEDGQPIYRLPGAVCVCVCECVCVCLCVWRGGGGGASPGVKLGPVTELDEDTEPGC